MSGRGETPDQNRTTSSQVAVGQTLYDKDGDAVGRVRALEEGGVFVTFREGIEALGTEHVRSGHSFGEAELVWRCMTCGEMGHICDGVPANCPGCDAPREELMYWTED